MELATNNENTCCFIVNKGQFHCYRLWWYNLYFKKKDKEEKAEGICAGMHSHFDIDNEVTLEMHWDTGHHNFSVSLGKIFIYLF